MAEIFPYQLVGFLDKEPAIGEPVYSGKNGWYPQIALKRRFNVGSMDEETLFQIVKDYCASRTALEVIVGKLTQTERMPVHVLEVKPTDVLMSFHRGFIAAFGQHIQSRFPERDGDNYYPHITAEYGGKAVINIDSYAERTFILNKVWLLKDVVDENSQAYASFSL